MDQQLSGSFERTTHSRRLLWMLLLIPVVASLIAMWALDHAKASKPLFSVTNLVGPTTRSLLAGGGITVCTEDMGTPGNPICFHAARMPATAVVVATGIRLFGDHYMRVASFKTILFLLPVELAIYLVWRRLPPSGWRRSMVVLLLLVPFGITAFLADASNLLVDEGFSYSFLALGAAMLFFDWPWSGLSRAVVFAMVSDGLYLAKSGMLVAVFALLAGFVVMERRAGLRWLVVALVAAAPIGWALHQHHASGRYSVGTSLDGINLHKGNNAGFLQNYPPRHGDSLDWYDSQLSRGVQFSDEWSFNDYHRDATIDYLWNHPRESFVGDLRKVTVLLFSFEKVGSSASHGARKMLEDGGMVLFRLMLWSAIGGAFLALLPSQRERDQRLRFAGAAFLALVATCSLPYLAGFAYTRHVSVLIYPAALLCCRLLCEPERDYNGSSMLTG